MRYALAVGGTWDDQGGRPSKLFAQLVEGFRIAINETHNTNVLTYNGGSLDKLHELLEIEELGAVLWMPDVSNDEPEKLIENIKKDYPFPVTLIGSKRLDGRDIGIPEVIDRMLKVKMNLCLVIDRYGDKFRGRIFDPLGNVFGDGLDFGKLGEQLGFRTAFLSNVLRVRSDSWGHAKWADEAAQQCDPMFFRFIQEYAAVFDSLVPRPKNVSRFLGNAAFRCTHGFPAYYRDGVIFVSRRNVDKNGIGPSDFVPVKPFRHFDDRVLYFGEDKPSVDTPVNLLLFHQYPQIRYLIHGHVYVEDAPFTSKPVPCGALEEFEEIRDCLQQHEEVTDNFSVNLRGHGCIIAGAEVSHLEGFEFYARPLEERHDT